MELVFERHFYEMARVENGWWTLDVPDAEPGQDYEFRLDRKQVRRTPIAR